MFNKFGEVPTREEIAESTYDVFAICKLFVLAVAFGTVGVPEKVGDTNGAFVTISVCKVAIFASSVTCLFDIFSTDNCNADIFASSVTCLLDTKDNDDCSVDIFASSVTCLLATEDKAD